MKLSIDFSPEIDYFIEQNSWATCVANSIVQIFYIMLKRQGFPAFLCSSSYLYYNFRALRGQEKENRGTTFDVALEAIKRYGMIPEDMWSSECLENMTESPPTECYEYAKTHTWTTDALLYEKPATLDEFVDLVSEYLADGYLLLISIYRFQQQHVNAQGFWTTPSLQNELDMGHAMLLCGIDFEKERLILVNSRIDHRKESITYLSFQDYSLIKPVWCRIKTRYDSIQCPSPLFYSIERQQQSRPILASTVSLPFSEWKTLESDIFYHHVIIGGGTLMAAYLAHQLRRLYPTQSILIIEEKMDNYQMRFFPNDTSHFLASTCCLPLHVNPLLGTLLVESEIPCEPSAEVYEIPVGFTNFLCDYLQITNLEDLLQQENIQKMISDPVYSSVYFRQVLQAWNPEQIPEKELRVPLPFLADLPLTIGVYTVLPYLTPSALWTRFNVDTLWQYLLKDFEYTNMSQILDDLPAYAFLAGWSANLTETDQDHRLSLFKKTTSNERCSDDLRLHGVHVYNMSPRYISRNLYDYVTQLRFRLTIFLKDPFDSTPTVFDIPDLGRCRVDHPFVVQIDVNQKDIFADLRLSKPDAIRNNIIFDVEIWSELQERIYRVFGNYGPTTFSYYESEPSSLQFLNICVQQENIQQVLEQQFAMENSVHWLNPNSAFMFDSLEGMYQMVDLFLQQCIRYYDKDNISNTLQTIQQQNMSRKQTYSELLSYLLDDVLKVSTDMYAVEGYHVQPNGNDYVTVTGSPLMLDYFSIHPTLLPIQPLDQHQWEMVIEGTTPFLFKFFIHEFSDESYLPATHVPMNENGKKMTNGKHLF